MYRIRRTQSNNRLMAISLACGILCALCVFLYTQTIQSQADIARAEALEQYGGSQIEVCVASKDVLAGQTIDASCVQTRLWVADLLPEGAVQSSSEIIGKKSTVPIYKGEVFSLKKFEESNNSIDVPEGLSAISVPTKDVQAVGGSLSAGMKVDMYATGNSGTSLIGQGILVLGTSSTEASKSSSSISWVTLAVEPSYVQEIVVAAQNDHLYFVLPGQDADAKKNKDDISTRDR